MTLKPFSLYLTVIFLLSIMMGLQIISVPWLALDYLGLSPFLVGVIQFSVLIPHVLLLVVGGASADRGLLLRKWLWLLIFYGLAHGYLLLLLNQHLLSFISLLVYGSLLGCITAFMQPFKDHLIALFADGNFQDAVAKHSLCQYIGQIVGITLATPLYLWQIKSLPLVQLVLVILVFVCFLVFLRHHSGLFDQSHSEKLVEKPSRQLLGIGFKHCWQSSVLRNLIMIVAISGFFHIGVFVVALPLLAKEVYIGDVAFYSLLQGLFLVGNITTMLIIILRGQLDAPGRRVIFSLLYTGLILFALSLGPTSYGLMFLVFLWGITVGVSSTLGRAILHSQTIAEYRGRTISIYQLALFGCAPMGAFFAGIITEYWGVLFVLKISAGASIATFFALFLTRSLWDLELIQPKL